MTRKELQIALKETIQAYSDDNDCLLLERLDAAAWNRITDKVEGELRKVGIKVIE